MRVRCKTHRTRTTGALHLHHPPSYRMLPQGCVAPGTKTRHAFVNAPRRTHHRSCSNGGSRLAEPSSLHAGRPASRERWLAGSNAADRATDRQLRRTDESKARRSQTPCPPCGTTRLRTKHAHHRAAAGRRGHDGTADVRPSCIHPLRPASAPQCLDAPSLGASGARLFTSKQSQPPS